MAKKMVIKVSMDGSCKTRSKALQIVVGFYGVQSAALGEKDKNQIEVTGEGVDAVELTKSLRKKLAKWPRLACLSPKTEVFADIISLNDVEEKKVEKKVEKKEEPKPVPPPAHCSYPMHPQVVYYYEPSPFCFF